MKSRVFERLACLASRVAAGSETLRSFDVSLPSFLSCEPLFLFPHFVSLRFASFQIVDAGSQRVLWMLQGRSESIASVWGDQEARSTPRRTAAYRCLQHPDHLCHFQTSRPAKLRSATHEADSTYVEVFSKIKSLLTRQRPRIASERRELEAIGLQPSTPSLTHPRMLSSLHSSQA